MAHVLRRSLHALCSSRLLSSSATASKLLTSPDPRLFWWRWYGEGVFWEDNCISINEIDEISMATKQEDTLVKESEGSKGGAVKKDHTTPSMKRFNLEDPLELSLGKLTNLVSDKSEATSNVVHDIEVRSSQSEADIPFIEESSKSAIDKKWQEMINNMHTVALEKQIKNLKRQDMGWLSKFSLKGMKELDKEGDNQSRRDLNKGSDRFHDKEAFDELTMSDKFDDKVTFDDRFSGSSATYRPFADSKQTSRKPTCSPFFGEISRDYYGDSKETSRKSDCSSFFGDMSRNYDGDGEYYADSKETSRKSTWSSSFGEISRDESSQDKNSQGTRHTVSKLIGKDSSFASAPQVNNVQVQNGQPIGRNDKLNLAEDTTLFGTRDATRQPSSHGNPASKKGYMVSVHNLPPTCNPSSIRASMAVHGEVTGIFKKLIGSDKLIVYIQFKTAEAMENALAAQKLQVGNRKCSIGRANHSVFTSVVRIGRVNLDDDESHVRAICEKYGKVDDIRERATGIFEVVYDTKELDNMANILARLNKVTLNGCTWYAFPAPTLHPSMQKDVLKSPEGRSWHQRQVSHTLNRLETSIDIVSVLFEDLQDFILAAREFT